MTASDDLLKRAESVMPGGVSSPVRAFRAVHGVPRVLVRGEGAHVWDLEGRRYVDLQLSFGPHVLGHAHPDVARAVAAAAQRGTSFAAPHPDEVALAEEITRRHPAAEWIRFTSSGTEAVMSAVRLARAATGRDVLLKFEGSYHGHADALLVKGGSGLATFGLGTSAGVPADAIRHTAVLPLDDEEALESFFANHGPRLACALVEGVPANSGLLPQRKEWLETLSRLCRGSGALLLVDEVITGFRLGWAGACGLHGLKPDLVTFGKVIGGGLPIGAYGGRADLMRLVAPLGPVYQAGTLSGNPLTMAAGLATLRALAAPGDAFGILDRRAAAFAGALRDAAADARYPATVVRLGSLLWFLPQGGEPPRRPDGVHLVAAERFAPLHAALLDEGVYLPPSVHETLFTSLAHDEATLEEAAGAFTRALARARRADAEAGR